MVNGTRTVFILIGKSCSVVLKSVLVVLQDANVKYSEAIDLLFKSSEISEAKKIRLKQKLFTYRAETFLHLEKPTEAEKDATEAIRCGRIYSIIMSSKSFQGI